MDSDKFARLCRYAHFSHRLNGRILIVYIPGDVEILSLLVFRPDIDGHITRKAQ